MKKIPKYLDKSLPIEERKKDYQKHLEKMMNPIPKKDFKPETFNLAMEGFSELADRKRILPPKELPTFNLKPKEIRVGQMIGMYESKQDLYLIFAHRCNELQKKVEELEARIQELEKHS